MTATPSTDPVVLVDVDDLAEADLDADLAERLTADGRVFPHPDAAGTPAADAVSLAEAIRRAGAAVAAAHALGLRAAALAR